MRYLQDHVLDIATGLWTGEYRTPRHPSFMISREAKSSQTRCPLFFIGRYKRRFGKGLNMFDNQSKGLRQDSEGPVLDWLELDLRVCIL